MHHGTVPLSTTRLSFSTTVSETRLLLEHRALHLLTGGLSLSHGTSITGLSTCRREDFHFSTTVSEIGLFRLSFSTTVPETGLLVTGLCICGPEDLQFLTAVSSQGFPLVGERTSAL